MRRLLLCAAASFTVLVTGACAGGFGQPTPGGGGSQGAGGATHRPGPGGPTVPGASWQKVAPAAVGLDPAKLDQLAATAQQGKSNCLVVVRHGKIAGEWYFNGTTPDTTQNVFSATKSIIGTLVGIAQDDHDLRIGQSASRWITPWRGTTAQAVTVRDLLSMDSGRAWSFDLDYNQLIHATDRTAFAVGLPQTSAPGQVWAYNNAAVQTLQRVLATATGTELTGYAQQRLFAPIGMSETRMTKDGAGNAQTFEGVQSTCRDMARFGLLMLDHGRWGGTQVVSPAWVAQATGPSSTKLNAAYGYLWWLNHEGVIAGPLSATSLQDAMNPTTTHGRLVPAAPDSMYWALGLGNQLVQVDPGSDTVVVRLGSAQRPKPPTFGPAEASAVTRAVIGR
jgi:CubicO group peptidase (beta-lactamase class C family)